MKTLLVIFLSMLALFAWGNIAFLLKIPPFIAAVIFTGGWLFAVTRFLK